MPHDAQLAAERAKVACLRSRILGLWGALREAQDEAANALRVGAQYREAAETGQARIEALEAAAREALDGWEEGTQYKGAYLTAKHGDAERIAELRALVGPEPACAACEVTAASGDAHGHSHTCGRGPAADPQDEERPAVCRFGAPGCPGWPPDCCPDCLERYRRARANGMPPSGRHG